MMEPRADRELWVNGFIADSWRLDYSGHRYFLGKIIKEQTNPSIMTLFQLKLNAIVCILGTGTVGKICTF